MSDQRHLLLTFFGVSAEYAYRSVAFSRVSSRRCEPCRRCYEAIDDSYETFDVELGIAPRKGHAPQAIDILYDFPLLREDLLIGFLEAGITGFKYHKVKFTQNAPDDDFYLLEVTGRVDVEILDDGEGKVCPICLSYVGKRGGKYEWNQQLLPILDSWDGSDLVRINNRAHGKRFCSRRVVDLAFSRGWTELRFGETIPHVLARREDGIQWHESVKVRAMEKWPHLFENE